MLYWIMGKLANLISLLPLRVLHSIGKVLAFFTWHLSKDRRHVAITNAKIIGVENPKKVARRSFNYTFMAYLETFYSPRLTEKFVKERVSYKNFDYYQNMKKENIKAVLVGAHFGSWALMANMFSIATGDKVVTIGRSSHNEALDKVMADLRTFDKVAYITHRGAIEQLSHFLSEGYIPGVYLDHTALPKDCVNVPFFGYKAPTIAGIYAFAVRKNLPVIPLFCRFVSETTYELIAYPLIYPDKNIKSSQRIEKLAADVNKVYEDIFKQYPEQWYLIHRRFKRVEEKDGTLSDRVYRS